MAACSLRCPLSHYIVSSGSSTSATQPSETWASRNTFCRNQTRDSVSSGTTVENPPNVLSVKGLRFRILCGHFRHSACVQVAAQEDASCVWLQSHNRKIQPHYSEKQHIYSSRQPSSCVASMRFAQIRRGVQQGVGFIAGNWRPLYPSAGL